MVSPVRLLNRAVVWEATSDPEFPYSGASDGERFLVRMNDFPTENLYTVFVNGEPVLELEEWPDNWIRPPDSSG